MRPTLPLLSFMLFACDDPCKPGDAPTLEIGVGEDSFEPYTGQPLELVFGSQGGYHANLALHTTYLDGEELLSGTLIGRLNGDLVAEGNPWFQLDCEPDGEHQVATGLRLILRVPPEDVDEQILDVDVTISDSRAVELEASIQLLVRKPS